MPTLPLPHWRIIHGMCWVIDWRAYFSNVVKWNGGSSDSGEMRGFHVVFRIRVNATGTLVFWDDDGCVIRRRGQVVHHDLSAHVLTRHLLDVSEGDELEIAQWQKEGDWLWGARVTPVGTQNDPPPSVAAVLLPYLDAVRKKLNHPDGPVLKLYGNGGEPGRTVLSIYSMILNGFSPAKVQLYGSDQWSPAARDLFAAALPFAENVPQREVLNLIASVGGARLKEMARLHWPVMKALVGLLCPPEEFCLMDDDVFVLDRTDDARLAFETNDLVHQTDEDHGEKYLRVWGWMNGNAKRLPTARLNAGLYWMRNRHDARRIAGYALRVRADNIPAFLWEQGLIANLFASGPTFQLPFQRYMVPMVDGLPGGILGYDYQNNPCGFACIHFAGLLHKPTDETVIFLADQVLNRHR